MIYKKIHPVAILILLALRAGRRPQVKVSQYSDNDICSFLSLSPTC